MSSWVPLLACQAVGSTTEKATAITPESLPGLFIIRANAWPRRKHCLASKQWHPKCMTSGLQPAAPRAASPSAQKSSCGAAVAVGAVLVGPDKKMPRPRGPRRRTGMILGLAERYGVFPGIVIPVPGAIPRIVPDSRSTYATGSPGQASIPSVSAVSGSPV